MSLWIIKRVVPHTTKHVGLLRWEVQASRTCDPFNLQFLTTLSQLKASLCDRACEKDLTVKMDVERTKNGLEIQSVELADRFHQTPEPSARVVIGAAELFERR